MADLIENIGIVLYYNLNHFYDCVREGVFFVDKHDQ